MDQRPDLPGELLPGADAEEGQQRVEQQRAEDQHGGDNDERDDEHAPVLLALGGGQEGEVDAAVLLALFLLEGDGAVGDGDAMEQGEAQAEQEAVDGAGVEFGVVAEQRHENHHHHREKHGGEHRGALRAVARVEELQVVAHEAQEATEVEGVYHGYLNNSLNVFLLRRTALKRASMLSWLSWPVVLGRTLR